MKLYSGLIILLLPFFLVVVSFNIMFAQEPAVENSFYQSSLVNTLTAYHQSFGNQGALYNGSEYKEYQVRFKEGQPYFQYPHPVVGSIIYEGILYDSIQMRYDEITDELVVHDQTDRIQLLKEKISFFHVYNSDFIKIEKDSLSTSVVSSGFYNVLYKGKVSLLKKEVKSVREDISSNTELLYYVDEKDYYYIQKEGRFYHIKNKRSLLSLMKDKKKEVQQFIKTNGLNFPSDKQSLLTQTTAYYDSLKN